MRKTILFSLLFIALFNVTTAQQLRTPQPSSTQTIKQDFGLGTVELVYSRPSAKGRKVMGDVVPFGKVWRTGANQATTITFTDEVNIGGTKVPAGKYGLVTIPGADKWSIIVSKQLDITSPDAHKPESDVVRFEAKPVALRDKVETFTMQFADVKPNAIALNMAWENTAVSLPITTEIEGKVMAQIDNIMSRDNRPYYQAAMYYMDNGKDLNKALTWFDKATEQNPDAYWVWHARANCLAKLGKKAEAVTSANKSLEIAKKEKDPAYVAMNEKLISSLK
jgi:hypothetical protein